MTICERCGKDVPENDICICQKGSKTFRVELCYELGAGWNIKAETPEEAEQKIMDIMDYSGIGETEDRNDDFDTVHRHYWTQGAEEIK